MNEPEQIVALVVEDECFVRIALVEYLQEAGYQVLHAENGAAALAILNNGQIVDVLVTDIRLGEGSNGWAVAKSFRERNPKGRVIYVSGNSIEQARAVAGSVFLPKPYVIEDILNACRELT